MVHVLRLLRISYHDPFQVFGLPVVRRLEGTLLGIRPDDYQLSAPSSCHLSPHQSVRLGINTKCNEKSVQEN